MAGSIPNGTTASSLDGFGTILHLLPAHGTIRLPIDEQPNSGLVRAAGYLAAHQADAGCTTELAGLCAGESPADHRPRVRRVRPVPFARLGNRDYRYASGSLLSVARARPRILHGHHMPYWFSLPGHRLNVLHLHMSLADASPQFIAAARRADLIVVPSRYIAGELSKFDDLASRCHVVPNGTSLVEADPVSTGEARRRLGLPLDEHLVVFVGQISPLKGVVELIEAVRRLPDHLRQTTTLAIIGSSGLWQGISQSTDSTDYETRARSLSLSMRARWLGLLPPDEINLWIAAATIVAAPSLAHESFGMVALDALASGRPVLASTRGALPELVEDGVSGRLVDPPDRDQLTTTLREMLDNADWRETAGRAGRRKAMDYGWAGISRRVLSLYEEHVDATAHV
jgi:glycosyltransferase involved in cell wall biosynthesis